ncbi:MAG TPA: hypothetical protein VIM11_23020 [Tepidisphaeraceae bacterium]
MYSTWVASIVALTIMAGVQGARAADPPANPPENAADGLISSPDKLLESLSNPDWHERRDAIHQLIGLGPAGDEAVKNLLRRTLDQEQRKNVGLALQLIEDNRLFGPSLITLHVKGAPATDVLNSMGKQANASLPIYPIDLMKLDRWPTVTLNLDHAPFWDAMRELGNQLSIDYLSDSQELRITRGSGRVPQGTISRGAFLLTARAGGSGGRGRGMAVELSVIPEPKITILRTTALKLDKAVDDQGNPLTSQSGRGFGRGGRGFGGRFVNNNRVQNGPRQVSGLFQKPPEAEKISELRGQLTVCVLGGSTRWEIADPMNMGSVSRTIDSIPVTLESVSGTGDSYALRATIPSGSSGGDVQINEIADLMHRTLKLLDAGGHELSAGPPDRTPGLESIELEVTFSTRPAARGGTPTGPPAKLIWDIPQKTRDVIIPFQFKNIPIDDWLN